jgi:diaminopimelate epimerase
MNMNMNFHKYQGTGNDFIILDNRRGKVVLQPREIAFLCNRHFGIGADGLMLLEQKAGYDYYLKYYNSDGNESSMCGNGGRCATAFARNTGIIGNTAKFYAFDGEHEAEILQGTVAECNVRLKMRDAQIGNEFRDGYFIDTGSPHFVKFVKSLESVNMVEEGRVLRYDPRFAPAGTNVDFVENNIDGISVRTYERGVEDETLSCGTGVTASALVTAWLHPGAKGYVNISTTGGRLKVHFIRNGEKFTKVYLEGPARYVFSGEISL